MLAKRLACRKTREVFSGKEDLEEVGCIGIHIHQLCRQKQEVAKGVYVSELTCAARCYGEVMRGDAEGFSLDSSRTSNSSSETRRRSSFREQEAGNRPYQSRGYQRKF